ncbi:hypothetical protein [Halosimplex salinum]|uniref:hypothetical protein n=1 Tax=Halosimplex salinum TaxID=1710538 RepID=UPI000F477B79|nr:hypothetical protein [Halosimplex salinum]
MSRVNAGSITDAGRRFARSAGRRAFVVELAVAVGLLVLAQAYLNLLNVVLHPVRTFGSRTASGLPAMAYLSFAVVDEVLRSVLTSVWVAQLA